MCKPILTISNILEQIIYIADHVDYGYKNDFDYYYIMKETNLDKANPNFTAYRLSD